MKIKFFNAVAACLFPLVLIAQDAGKPEPAPAEPAPAEPAPAEPAPAEPAPAEPAPTEPEPTEPEPTEPEPTEPAPTEPALTEPALTEPALTEPAPLVAQPRLPGEQKVYDYDNHRTTWDDSPFSRRIVEPPPPAAPDSGPSPWEGWKLAAVDKFGDKYTIGLTTKKGEFRLLKLGEETEEGVKLTKVESNGIIGETTIHLAGNGHEGPLAFDTKRLIAAVKGPPVPKKAAPSKGKLPARPPGMSDRDANIKRQQEAARAKIREQMLKARSSRGGQSGSSRGGQSGSSRGGQSGSSRESQKEQPKRRVTLPPTRK